VLIFAGDLAHIGIFLSSVNNSQISRAEACNRVSTFTLPVVPPVLVEGVATPGVLALLAAEVVVVLVLFGVAVTGGT
jgi:hypothetical protein